MRNNDKEKIQIKFYLQENERIKNLVESIKKEKQNYKNLINRRNSEIKDLTNHGFNLIKQLNDNESEFKGLKGEVITLRNLIKQDREMMYNLSYND